ncbi:MAG: four-helix bundle copper-binding protein [Nitrospinae bacterium]|nr:four-helix bundle copper-binding protein [Nitrospinota bacterium]
MNRRELIIGAGAMAVAAVSGTAFAADEHQHHHASGGGAYDKLISEAVECMKRGELCLHHCFTSFAAGDTALAACASSVNDMLAFCAATVKIAANESKYAKEAVATCMKICQDCENECRKHEKKHATCKDCADSCAKCVAECKNILAAA